MGFTQKIINGFEQNQREAACEIAASRPGHRTFVGVYPPHRDRPRVQSPMHSARREKWLVRKFTIPDRLINEHFGEEDLLDCESVFLNTLAEVEDLLIQWGIDSAIFEPPWKIDYPL